MKTLFLQAPSFDGFDGGAGSRFQTRREIDPSGIRPGSRNLPRWSRAAASWTRPQMACL